MTWSIVSTLCSPTGPPGRKRPIFVCLYRQPGGGEDNFAARTWGANKGECDQEDSAVLKHIDSTVPGMNAFSIGDLDLG